MDKEKLNLKMIEMNKKFNRAMSKIRSAATIKDCFHPNKEECVMPIISAHSLQRQGSLKILEKTIKGNAFIYTHTEREPNLKDNYYDLKPVGRKTATTFDGFCSYHDTALFKAIENEPEITDINNDEHLFLHSYRSFAIAYHSKMEQLKLYKSADPEVIELLDQMYNITQKDEGLKGVEAAINDLKKPKEAIDKLLNSNDFSGLEYLVFEYPHTAPVGCASFITPHSLPSGKSIQRDTFAKTQSSVITTVLPFSDRTIVILAAFSDDLLACDFLDKIEDLKYELKIQKFLSYFIFEGAENVVVSPNYIDNKPLEWRKEYCELINYIADNSTPFLNYNEKKFHINYFDISCAIV